MTPPKKTGPFAYFACDGKLDASTLANSEPALRTLACWTGWAVILQLQYDRPYTNSSHHSNGKVSSTLGVSDDTGVVKEALIYDPAPCLHHTPRITPGPPRLLAWCRAFMEAIVNPKRPSTRRDTSYPRAPAEYSDRCRFLTVVVKHTGTHRRTGRIMCKHTTCNDE